MDKLAVAKALDEMASHLRLKGENPFRARAYERAARAVEVLEEELGVLVEEGRLAEVSGIGAALAAHITELYRTGSSGSLEKLRAETPAGVLALAKVTSEKRARAIHDALGVSTIDELKAACEAGRVKGLKGFGAATERSILESIRKHETTRVEVLLVEALEEVEPILGLLKRAPGVQRVELAGAARRRAESLREAAIVVGAADADALLEAVRSFPGFAGVEQHRDDAVVGNLPSGLPVELRIVPAPRFASELLLATGSDGHVAKLRTIARRKPLEGETEHSIYASLGLQYVPPELRDDTGELDDARAGELPEDLVDVEDIQGMVHCHTIYSDGRNTVEEMARSAEALGMKYITITDHSPSAHYARGVELDRLKQQWDEIARVQEQVSIQILRGTESDILADGALDYPDAILEQFDVIIASIHSRFKMDRAQMTERIMTAMKLPVFKIWGHALGRLVNRRDPIDCDVPRILDAIAESRAAIEVNGDPYRLDLPPQWVREARKRGIKFVVSTDAHSTGALSYLPFGIGIARRGRLRRGEVLNTLDAAAFRGAVRPAA